MKNYLIYLLKNALSTVLLIITDLCALVSSFYLAYIIRSEIIFIFIPNTAPVLYGFRHFYNYSWVFLIYFMIFSFNKLYLKRLAFWDETREVLKATFAIMLLSFSVIFMIRTGTEASRWIFVSSFPIFAMLLPLSRLFSKKILTLLHIWKENVLIAGAGNAGRETLRGITAETHMGYNVIGFLDDDANKHGKAVAEEHPEIKVMDKIFSYKKIQEQFNISTIFFAIPSIDSEKLTQIVNKLHNDFKRVIIVPELKGITLLNTEFNYLFMQELFLLNAKNNLKSFYNKIFKSLLDITISIMAFITLVCLSPFIIVLIVLVKTESAGPVLFTQKRVGKNGKLFNCYKFRTMYKDAEDRLNSILSNNQEVNAEYQKFRKIKNDPRITPIGKILRKTSLDELPQILNIFKGEMSFIGPRPALPDEMEEYYKENSFYYSLVKPGITGLWQVSGRNETDFLYRVHLEMWYVLNWSVWLDIIILFKTVRVVLFSKGRGAY